MVTSLGCMVKMGVCEFQLPQRGERAQTPYPPLPAPCQCLCFWKLKPFPVRSWELQKCPSLATSDGSSSGPAPTASGLAWPLHRHSSLPPVISAGCWPFQGCPSGLIPFQLCLALLGLGAEESEGRLYGHPFTLATQPSSFPPEQMRKYSVRGCSGQNFC